MVDEPSLNQKKCPWCENKNIQSHEEDGQTIWRCHNKECDRKWKFIVGVTGVIEMK